MAATRGSANHHRLGTNAADRELVDPSTAAAASTDGHSWSFKEALLYSVTVITTIGKQADLLPRLSVSHSVTSIGSASFQFVVVSGVVLWRVHSERAVER